MPFVQSIPVDWEEGMDKLDMDIDWDIDSNLDFNPSPNEAPLPAPPDSSCHEPRPINAISGSVTSFVSGCTSQASCSTADAAPSTSSATSRVQAFPEVYSDFSEEDRLSFKLLHKESAGYILKYHQRSSIPQGPAPSCYGSAEAHYQQRTRLMTQFMRYLNHADLHGLRGFVQEHCTDQVMLLTPDIRDPIFSQADLLLLCSLLLETYPDGLWVLRQQGQGQQEEAERRQASAAENKVHCRYRFWGTKVYAPLCQQQQQQPYAQQQHKQQMPIEAAFKQIKAKQQKRTAATGMMAEEEVVVQQEVAERMLSMRTAQQPLSSSAPAAAPSAAVLLRQGKVAANRQANFFFDDQDRILRIIAFNV